MRAQIERVGMSLDEFIAESHKQRFELIDGKRIPMLPDVFGPSSIMNALYRKMLVHSESCLCGDVYLSIRPLELVPDLAVEVISPTDHYTDVNNKVKAYLQDGVRIVWVIDGQNHNAVVYAVSAEPRHLGDGDVLSGGDVLPEFELPLKDLFR
jgi:hypothetical protein